MSKAVSALNGASFEGFVSVQDAEPVGMITLRGDLTSAAVKKSVKSVVGTDVPGRGMIVTADDLCAAWMSPDELLIICAYADAGTNVAKMQKTLSKSHALVANVSDARTLMTLSGKGIREALAKLTPADVSESELSIGQLCRSRLAQVPAAFWLTSTTESHVICFRSVGQYVFDILKSAALPGSEVGYFQDN